MINIYEVEVEKCIKQTTTTYIVAKSKEDAINQCLKSVDEYYFTTQYMCNEATVIGEVEA